jgi:chemosensory pili system protein ChpA (sensor histidine kinase/response regulator)
MMLEGSNSCSAIRWVREDLDACLDNVRRNLEAFANDRTQREPLVAVQEELERLNLTFLTMRQRGASILTDEMIAVGGHMLHNGHADCDESLNALTDAVVVLPSYLDRLQAGHEDLPILLLPTLNELRASYDESLLSEGTLFAPGLDVIIPELSGSEADAIARIEFGAFSRRTRSLYQGALLGWLKEQSKTASLEPMQQVCRSLYTRLGRNELRRLWWIAERAMQGLRDGSIENDLPLRRLFARLDLTLKAMVDGGPEGPSSDTVTALSRALLFHAAQARPGSKATDILRERFHLEELIPDRDALLRARGAVTGRDAGLFQSIGEAVREELGLIKDTLDMELRTGHVDAEQRAASTRSLEQLADTLGMLNLPVPAKAVEDLLPALAETGGVNIRDLDSPLLALAQKLIEVESLLDTHMRLLGEPVETDKTSEPGVMSADDHQQILGALFDQCIATLHEVQEAIRQRLGGEAEADFATGMQHIAGALAAAGQSESAALTEKLTNALDEALAPNAPAEGDAPDMETLADAVAALELHLAGRRDQQQDASRYLQIMHQRLGGLPEAEDRGEPQPETYVAPPQVDAEEPPAQAGQESLRSSDSGMDPAMLAIFLDEFDLVREQLDDLVGQWLQNRDDAQVLAEIRRGFHTLKGSGRMVGAREAGEFAWRFEELLNRLIERPVERDPTVLEVVQRGVAALPALRARMLGEPTDLEDAAVEALQRCAQQLALGSAPDPQALKRLPPVPEAPAGGEDDAPEGAGTGDAPAETEASLEQLLGPPELDPALRHLMTGEIRSHLGELEAFVEGLNRGMNQPVDPDLVRSVHTLAGNLSMAPLGQEVEVARALEQYLENRLNSERAVTRAAAVSLQACLDRFQQRLRILESDGATAFPVEDEALIVELSQLAAKEDTPRHPVADEDRASPATAEEVSGPEPAAETPDPIGQPPAADAAALEVEDEGILSIFLEEATEVLERCDSLLNRWRDKLTDRKLVQSLQREIHTFKGGARMAGLEDLGEFCHAMETLLERIAGNTLDATVAAVQALEEGCDSLNLSIEQLQSRRMPDVGPANRQFRNRVTALQPQASGSLSGAAMAGEHPPAIIPEADRRDPGGAGQAEGAAAIESAAEAAGADAGRASAPADERRETAAPAPSQTAPAQQTMPGFRARPAREFREIEDRPVPTAEDAAGGAQIRVAADLMDKLVNYAGEISIYRSRLEQQMSAVRFNLKEVDATVHRLKEQLRKMDMESEAQMMSRYQSASSSKAASDFDPLELDRFSNMQQLSRALAESVSDLLNLHEMLDDSVRQADGLLTQQSRVATDLQEGLMQTRMTPFGQAAPRLRRVVRAAATETGKKARLRLRMAGSSDHLDRNVLERITAPLEHMLRNAVAHGIEPPRQRRRAKKAEEGEITVTVEAEATEFVIRVEDDGAGIDLEAVRKRAIERGLLNAEDEVQAQRLVQFIRESGFSTAKSVTGLAGRGVGMDVVNNEIKQIGGSMEIETAPGQGTRFTIRIPFSLAVMQAIGVSVGDRLFQIPLNSVAGVARVAPAEYTALLQSEAPAYHFAGEAYPLLELEPLLDAPPLPLENDNVSLLMIRAGDCSAAIRVAALQGHQEIVVKPVGPQISSIPGILGGTIAADGQVMIILDMGPLIRRGLESAARPSDPVPAAREEVRQPLVMVVDDSITMRKVTSRVLENHALQVMTAQDGVDAIEKLHDQVPDLLLLDIEMPRMDGYQLLEHVRSDARLRHVPVVMITSRAGQKHRRKAREAGANAYLTKPYQELELIERVSEMLEIDLLPKRTD